MARVRDWGALAERYKKEATVTGISVKDWCALHKIPVNSARRYIKPLSSGPVITGEVITEVSDQSDQPKQSQDPKAENNQKVTISKTNEESGLSDHHKKIVAKRNPNMARPGNQNARTHGHYSEFITTDEDLARYLSSQTSTLNDELNLFRMQTSNLMVAVKSIERELSDPLTEQDKDKKVRLIEALAKFQLIINQKVARIESLSNSLLANEKAQVAMAKDRAITRKANLEADKLARETGGNETPLGEIYEKILNNGNDGMLSTL